MRENKVKIQTFPVMSMTSSKSHTLHLTSKGVLPFDVCDLQTNFHLMQHLKQSAQSTEKICKDNIFKERVNIFFNCKNIFFDFIPLSPPPLTLSKISPLIYFIACMSL